MLRSSQPSTNRDATRILAPFRDPFSCDRLSRTLARVEVLSLRAAYCVRAVRGVARAAVAAGRA
jgi:hypothetical protein